MAKMRPLRTVGAEYLDTAPVREKLTQAIPASAKATFASLEDADAWPVWLVPINQVEWTSPKPFGVGTTRTVTGQPGAIEEVFFDWEDGVRMSFHFSATDKPVFAAFAEDYLVTPTGEDTCTLTWRYGFECAGPLRLLQKLIGFGFKRSAVKSLSQLADYMEANAGKYE